MKIQVTEKYLLKVLERLKEMKRYGTYNDLIECEKLINNTSHYLKNNSK